MELESESVSSNLREHGASGTQWRITYVPLQQQILLDEPIPKKDGHTTYVARFSDGRVLSLMATCDDDGQFEIEVFRVPMARPDGKALHRLTFEQGASMSLPLHEFGLRVDAWPLA